MISNIVLVTAIEDLDARICRLDTAVEQLRVLAGLSRPRPAAPGAASLPPSPGMAPLFTDTAGD